MKFFVFFLIFFSEKINLLNCHKVQKFLQLKNPSIIDEIKSMWNTKGKCDELLNGKIDDLLFTQDETSKEILREIALHYYNPSKAENKSDLADKLSYTPPTPQNHSNIFINNVSSKTLNETISKVQRFYLK